MERAKAIAIAAAVAMSLTSGAAALGANLGALGFGGGSSAGPAPQVSVVAATPRVGPKTAPRLQQPEHDHTELRAESAANPKD